MKKFLKVFAFSLLTLFLLSSEARCSDELKKVRIDTFDGGQDSFDLASVINPNQGKLFKNVVINRKGKLSKRKGQALFAQDLSNIAFTGIGRFDPDQSTSYLVTASGTIVQRSLSSPASWVTANPKNALTTGKNTEFVQANALLFILNGQDPTANYSGSVWDPGSSSTASPPIATTGAWLRNYLFCAGNPTNGDWVYFSNNLAPKTFTVTDVFKVNTGDGQKIMKLEVFRLNELIVYKERSIYVLDITGATPLTDWSVQPISKVIGCIAPRSVVGVGNDQIFLSSDPIAVRTLARSSFDKILVDIMSQPIQDIFDGTGDTVINKTVISKASAVFFDNKYILAIAIGPSTVNNYVVVFDFFTKSWYTITGWYPAAWQVFNNNLYYIDALDGRVVQCFTGTTGDMASGPIVTSASEPTVGISFEYVSKNIDFDNAENFKQPDALDVEFGTSGNYNANVYLELDDGGYQNIGTVSLKGGAPNLPINLPFNLGASGVARKTFQIQRYGEFKKLKVRFLQEGVSELCELHWFTSFGNVKNWRRE